MTIEQALAQLRDGVSRPVTMMEREKIADVIDNLRTSLQAIERRAEIHPDDIWGDLIRDMAHIRAHVRVALKGF